MSGINKINPNQSVAGATLAPISTGVVQIDTKKPGIFSRVIMTIIKVIAMIICPPYGIYKAYQHFANRNKITQPVTLVLTPTPQKSFAETIQKSITNNPKASAVIATSIAAAAIACYFCFVKQAPIAISIPQPKPESSSLMTKVVRGGAVIGTAAVASLVIPPILISQAFGDSYSPSMTAVTKTVLSEYATTIKDKTQLIVSKLRANPPVKEEGSIRNNDSDSDSDD